MTSLHQEATTRTPEVLLDSAKGMFVLKGESYPEDITGFFGPVRIALTQVLDEVENGLNVEIKLIYFNSSSARVLMEIMDQMDEKAAEGVAVNVKWYCDPDDDITREFAEDISEDLSSIDFTIIDEAIE